MCISRSPRIDIVSNRSILLGKPLLGTRLRRKITSTLTFRWRRALLACRYFPTSFHDKTLSLPRTPPFVENDLRCVLLLGSAPLILSFSKGLPEARFTYNLRSFLLAKMALSKEEWFVKDCVDVIHPHTTCNPYWYECTKDTFVASMKIYAPLYTVTTLLSRLSAKDVLTRAVPAMVRSSAFIGTSNFDTRYLWFSCRPFFGVRSQ